MLVGVIVIGFMLVNMALAVWISRIDNTNARETARKVLVGVNLVLLVSALGYVFLVLGLGKH